jgi:hypothetical protein
MSDPIRDLKRELVAAAERRHRRASMATALGGRLRPPSRALLIAASLSLVTAVALVVSAPWRDSPGLLEEAQAALTAPPNTIQYAKWQVTSSSTDPSCTVTRGPTELWVDTVPPYRWRVLRRDLPLLEEDARGNGSEPECSRGVTEEFGGTSDPVCTATGCEPILMFSAPNALRVSPVSIGFLPDPAHSLRDAIRHGLAHDEGTTTLGGRTVERIRLDPPCHAAQRCPGLTYAYVDPKTFYPIEIRQPEFRGVSSVVRFLTFEYLPRTAANLKLTNIRAEHPNAVVTGYRYP